MALAESKRLPRRKHDKPAKPRRSSSSGESRRSRAVRGDAREQSERQRVIAACNHCGKKYRVSAEKAGGTMKCKECFHSIHIPRLDVSQRTRAAVLAELGIDPDSAQAKYREERRESVRRRREAKPKLVYRCSQCWKVLDDPASSHDGAEGLRCEDCRAKDVEQRRRDDSEAKRKAKKPELVTAQLTESQAFTRALAYGAFFFVGFFGLVGLVVSSTIATAIVAGAVAALGGKIVFWHYRPAPGVPVARKLAPAPRRTTIIDPAADPAA